MDRLKNYFLHCFLGDRLKNLFEDLFFGEHEHLCPCPWPRAFLSLASRVSVLGRAVLGLGLGFFVSLALASSLVSSIPPLIVVIFSRGGQGQCFTKSAARQSETIFQPLKAQRSIIFFYFLKCSATSATNFLIQLKRNATQQMREGIFLQSAT